MQTKLEGEKPPTFGREPRWCFPLQTVGKDIEIQRTESRVDIQNTTPARLSTYAGHNRAIGYHQPQCQLLLGLNHSRASGGLLLVQLLNERELKVEYFAGRNEPDAIGFSERLLRLWQACCVSLLMHRAE